MSSLAKEAEGRNEDTDRGSKDASRGESRKKCGILEKEGAAGNIKVISEGRCQMLDGMRKRNRSTVGE